METHQPTQRCRGQWVATCCRPSKWLVWEVGGLGSSKWVEFLSWVDTPNNHTTTHLDLDFYFLCMKIWRLRVVSS
ncbi:hypothetical protein ACB092_06G112400 [Castanea dentata]